MAGRVTRALPAVVVLLVVVAALVLIATAHWRKGATALAGATGLTAVFRLLLPREWTPMLAVRGKVFDVAMSLALTALLGFTAWGF